MKKQAVGASLLRQRREILDRPPDAWMRGVVAVAVGPKIVEGKVDGTPALQFLVPRKLPNSSLAREERIPAHLGGFPTDIIRTSGELVTTPPPLLPSAAIPVGCGSPILSSLGDGEAGTVGCAAVVAVPEQPAVLLTARHVAPRSTLVHLRTPARPLIARSVFDRRTAAGRELYGDWAQNPDEIFLVDLAVLLPATTLNIHGGLPQGHSFAVAPNSRSLAEWFTTTWAAGGMVEAWSLGSSSGGWRRGFITSLWPVSRIEAATGFCLIQQETTSQPGDSGGLWLARKDAGLVAVGLHWGRLYDNFAMATDLTAAVPLARLSRLLNQPQASSPPS